jgi:hypothetical protein
VNLWGGSSPPIRFSMAVAGHRIKGLPSMSRGKRTVCADAGAERMHRYFRWRLDTDERDKHHFAQRAWRTPAQRLLCDVAR